MLLSVGLVAGYLLTNYMNTTTKKSEEKPTPTPTITSKNVEEENSEMEKTPTPTTSISKKKVSSGLTNSNAFKPYTIDIPSGWSDSKESDANAGIDKLTITKNGYTLTIYQAPFGGGGCLYGNEAEQPFTQKFSDYADISLGQYRRSWNKTGNQGGTIGYTVCQKSADNSYGSITQFGAISVKSPDPADSSVLSEIDSMIASITKQ